MRVWYPLRAQRRLTYCDAQAALDGDDTASVGMLPREQAAEEVMRLGALSDPPARPSTGAGLRAVPGVGALDLPPRECRPRHIYGLPAICVGHIAGT